MVKLDIYIAKEWRRKQVASEFVSQIMRFFQQKDICTIYVHVDLENQLAARF
ncbi:GNAT family N-acetyltransferase [Bacillus manliponensis]|uniref:GNAT family N-acetyltransferase n=1 Tax=Bacillus manliponensis TaxID=574376 RepID=UPI0035135B07